MIDASEVREEDENFKNAELEMTLFQLMQMIQMMAKEKHLKSF